VSAHLPIGGSDGLDSLIGTLFEFEIGAIAISKPLAKDCCGYFEVEGVVRPRDAAVDSCQELSIDASVNEDSEGCVDIPVTQNHLPFAQRGQDHFLNMPVSVSGRKERKNASTLS